MKNLIAIFTLPILLFACGTSQKTLEQSVNVSTENTKEMEGNHNPPVEQLVTDPTRAYAHSNVDKDVMVYFKRSVCFGQCPEDELSIYADGKAIYEGNKNTVIKGRREFVLTDSQKAELKRLVDGFNTNVIGDVTFNQPSDIPSKELIIKKDNLVYAYKYKSKADNDKFLFVSFMVSVIEGLSK